VPTIAKILLLAGIACFVLNSEAANAEFYCNIHHSCPDDGRVMKTEGFSKKQCMKGNRKFKSWGDGPRSPHTTCENLR
jgi:hypothetical protein